MFPRSRFGWVLLAAHVFAWLIILSMIGFVVAPTLGDLTTIGGHDWDQMESHRYLVTKTMLRFHQFPFWNPYACGGHPAWGGFESDSTVVSPWLPFYLTMSLAHAMRVEICGSAIVSAVGAWFLAGRFSRSPAARALAVVAFAVNGRWALQIAAGHTWHLGYALTPWLFYFYDRAADGREPPLAHRGRDVILAGATMALMVYTGAIYPLPQTMFLLGLYGLALAALARSYRPILTGLAIAAIGTGLAAPKLFPVIEVLSRYPRLVDSPETLDLTAFVQILTAHDQDSGSRPAAVNAWGWHEWGMYVGWAVVLFVMVGSVLGRGVRESPMKWAGVVALSLGFGSFDPHAPWPLLRHLPVFKSQHVPSRWLYPALLLLIIVAVAALEAMLQRRERARPWVELLLLPAVAWVAFDIATVARLPMGHVFPNHPPPMTESMGPFRTEVHMPAEINYAQDWAPHSLPAEMANIGTIDCGTFPAFHNYVRDHNGHVPGLGAHGRGDSAYRGEAYVAEGVGEASIVTFSPNVIAVKVTRAQAGEHVVLNQNWDTGWEADGAPALDWSDQAAAQLHSPDSTVVFRYRSRFLYLGLLTFCLTLAAIVGLRRLSTAMH